MNKLSICFSAPKHQTFVTKIIKYFSDSKFSHCFIKYVDKYDTYLIYESKGLGEKIYPFQLLEEKNIIYSEFELIGVYDERNFLHTIYNRIGHSYSYLQLIGYLPVILMKKIFHKKIKNPFRDGEEATTCNEAITIVMRDALGFDDLKNINLDDLDLRWLFEFCSNHSKLKRIK